MPPSKFESRKFVSVDPSKCTGCGICEYACTLEKGEAVWNPIRSRIRVVRMTPLFNFALACRFCEDAKCVKACPEKALSQCEKTGIIMVKEKQCKGCDWCVQACEHGGITIHSDTGKAITCDLCEGEPKCVEYCPEEALELVSTDEDAEKRFNSALEKLTAETERLTTTVKNKDWKPLLADAEKRSMKVTEKLEALNKKATAKKQK
jgi:carbon-monoxide dehydrogenase iron sulfur subunit